MKALCLGICQNWVHCDCATEVSDHVPHRTTYGQNNSWVVNEIPAEWLPVRCETNRPARAIGRNCRACARNVCQESSQVNTSREPGIADASVKCLAHSTQTSSRERIRAAAVAGTESPGSQSSFSLLRGFLTAARRRRVCWEAGFQRRGDVSCGKVNRHNVRIWDTSVIRLKWMCFVPFPLAKSTVHFSLQGHLLPVSTTWTCCSCG